MKYHDFPSKLFCLTLPKKVVREPFIVSLNSGMEKNFLLQRVMSGFSIFCRVFFVSQCQKIS